MTYCHTALSWFYAMFVVSMVTSYSIHDHRSTNDINLDFDKLERLGRTDSLIKALKDIAQSSHDCGIKDLPKLRRKFLSNDTITCNDGSPAGNQYSIYLYPSETECVGPDQSAQTAHAFLVDTLRRWHNGGFLAGRLRYYIRKSYGSKKWLIYLEGGWYCFDHVSCSLRWANNMQKYMSSKAWPKKRKVGGILSWNPEENPYYFHSNVVYIPYCSSDSWSGTSPKGANGNDFAFMGALILEQVIKDLIPRGLKHATKLILTGSSAGGTGVLINLDRVANQLSELAPEVEVRGIADSGWFLDYPQYRNKDCVEALSCSPVDGIKRGIKLWSGRVPESCMAEYPVSEHWRCYFGYRMYSTLKTPLYVIQHLFDEAQILVDNVFEQSQIRSDNSAALVTESQWQYLYKLGQEVRKTLENVSSVFAPSCLSHEVLMRSDWFNVSIKNIKLGQSIYCWENSYRYDKCILTTKKVNSIQPLNESLQGDAPKKGANAQKKKRKKKRRKNKNKRKQRTGKRSKNRASKRKNKNNKRRRRKSRTRRHHGGNCVHHLIDSCPLPQCNAACPKYRNRFTGEEMDFFKLFVRYGIHKKEIAEILGKDIESLETMDESTMVRLIMDYVGRTG